jgi:hypothetical protein
MVKNLVKFNLRNVTACCFFDVVVVILNYKASNEWHAAWAYTSAGDLTVFTTISRDGAIAPACKICRKVFFFFCAKFKNYTLSCFFSTGLQCLHNCDCRFYCRCGTTISLLGICFTKTCFTCVGASCIVVCLLCIVFLFVHNCCRSPLHEVIRLLEGHGKPSMANQQGKYHSLEV